MILHHEKPKILEPIISKVICLCENSIVYKYQVTLIAFDSCLLSSKILRPIRNFDKNSGISSAPFDTCHNEVRTLINLNNCD